MLLRNDGTLPLEGGLTAGADGRALGIGPARTIAVIGPNADDPAAVLGDWAGNSGQINWMPDGHPREMVQTVLDGVRVVVPEGWAVTYARGADIEVLVPDPAGDAWHDGAARAPIFSPAPIDEAQLAAGRGCCGGCRLRGGCRRRHDRPDRRDPLDSHPRAAGRPGRPPRCACGHGHARDRGAAPLEAGGASAVSDGRGCAHRGVQPGHARRAGDRRADPRPDRAHRADAPVRPAACRPATGVLQPDPRPARRALRRPHPGAAVRVRRGPELLDGGVLRPDGC